MRHGFSCVLPYNLSIIYPDNISTFIVRYDVDKCHINWKDHNAHEGLCCNNSTSRQDEIVPEQVNSSTATCIFTIHSLNAYIFNNHTTVSLNINYEWGKCYLVHTTLTLSTPVFHQIPVWGSRHKDEF